MSEGLAVPVDLQQHSAILSVLHEKLNVQESLAVLAAKYKSARPFPHIVIDNMFQDELLNRLINEMPPINQKKWVENNDEHLTKFNLRSAVELGETGYQLVAFLHSAAFLYFLSEVTGIFQLLPDPYLQGSGYHILPRGAKFDVHADRNTAYETGLTRRLSLITYLNKSWPHEYGGQLELWNADGTRCETVIEPVFNRTVIFEIGDQYFHGVPSHVDCPPGRSRNSWVVYYHTASHAQQAAPHTSIYSPSFYQNRRRRFSQMVKDITPPIIFRALRKMKEY
jgi:hypothetical protein